MYNWWMTDVDDDITDESSMLILYTRLGGKKWIFCLSRFWRKMDLEKLLCQLKTSLITRSSAKYFWKYWRSSRWTQNSSLSNWKYCLKCPEDLSKSVQRIGIFMRERDNWKTDPSRRLNKYSQESDTVEEMESNSSSAGSFIFCMNAEQCLFIIVWFNTPVGRRGSRSPKLSPTSSSASAFS